MLTSLTRHVIYDTSGVATAVDERGTYGRQAGDERE
jgi:hypothetical protein